MTRLFPNFFPLLAIAIAVACCCCWAAAPARADTLIMSEERGYLHFWNFTFYPGEDRTLLIGAERANGEFLQWQFFNMTEGGDGWRFYSELDNETGSGHVCILAKDAFYLLCIEENFHTIGDVPVSGWQLICDDKHCSFSVTEVSWAQTYLANTVRVAIDFLLLGLLLVCCFSAIGLIIALPIVIWNSPKSA